MTVINSVILLVRRINDLHRRREILVERQDRMRRSLPEWTFAPLQLAGMSASEIRGAMSEIDKAEQEVGLHQIEKEIEALDRQLDELDNVLLSTPATTVDCVRAVLDLALLRFRAQTPTDPNDLFYDYGDALVLRFLEKAAEDLRAAIDAEKREAV